MARQLTANEQEQIRIESDAWYPTLFTTYGTPAVKMLANPMKVAIINTAIYLVIAFLVIKFMKIKVTNHTILIVVIIGLFVAGISYYKQYITNGNVVGLLPMLPENATKFDYLNNYAVQGDLNRSSGYGRGSSLLAGAVGGAAASRFRLRK
jgi:hypothetical protein